MAHRTDEDRHRRRALADAASGHTAARLLPWTTEDGKPCLLLTDDRWGHLSRLADDVESLQLALGADVLEYAREVLDDPSAPEHELRFVGVRLSECLRDALSVAKSRGSSLPPRWRNGPTAPDRATLPTPSPDVAREHTTPEEPSC
ncbi:hypothetical protein ACSNOK_20490 [Streptomyces sp. URMC 126]|uniref:hypothetical protein n=1 Tax=Streptomyces sp. URMC 126 TaxID=3423401 RepID=UPI003F1BC855